MASKMRKTADKERATMSREEEWMALRRTLGGILPIPEGAK